MKYFIGLALLILIAASCAKQPAAEDQTPMLRDDDKVTVEEPSVVTPEAPAREAIYTYSQAQGNQRGITLRVNDEPVLIGDKYVVLIGVMVGRRQVALVEVGGSGRKLLLGDRLLNYRVKGINRTEIELIKGVGEHE